MKKILVLFLVVSPLFNAVAQNINQYKYILIPETYEFTGDVDQYQLNSLTKFLFEKEGFETLMVKEEKPADLKQNPCLALNTILENNSGLFVTKFILKLENCNGEVVFESEEGRSREKDYKVAYQEALRDAFESVNELNYSYKPSNPSVAVVPGTSPEVIKDQAEEMEEVEKVKETEEPTPVKIATEPKAIVDAVEGGFFEYNGQQYLLKSTAEGFGLYMRNSPEPIALLLQSGSGDSFLYNSLSHEGIAYFDEQGNLVVEYLIKETSKKTTRIYLKKDQ